MPRERALFKIRMVGQRPDHPRFVVRDARRLVAHFWTGKGWSRRLRDARLFADPADVARTIKRLTLTHLRRHQPMRLFLLTLVVQVHADEEVSKGEVEDYLRSALVFGVDHERCGTGPTADSLVEVVVPVISLEEGR